MQQAKINTILNPSVLPMSIPSANALPFGGGVASWADGSKGYASRKLKDLKKADSSLKTANYDGYVLSVGMTHNF